MRIRVAAHSGFCFGVRRAIKIAEDTLRHSRDRGNIYVLNPIIHNPQVVSDLSQKGLSVQRNINRIKDGTVIISSHGASADIVGKLKKKKIRIVDATCPFVKHAHDIVKGLKREGYKVVIIGDKKHPEVKALLSVAGKPLTLPLSPKGRGKGVKIGIVSQTTQSKSNYLKGILDSLKGDFTEARIFNTICNDTAARQRVARELLKQCDVMVVVGGKNSANTRRLWQICKESGVDSYHIETPGELKKEHFKGKKCAGLVSGASTPESVVKQAAQTIKSLT